MQIGPIELQDFEVPPAIHFGGGYRMRVHMLSSGQRAIERLGPDDDEIRFQGIFSGPRAESRVRELNSVRLSGKTIWLVWHSFRYPILIKHLTASYENPWWIPYSIRCVVARQSGVSDTLARTAATPIESDIATAITLLSDSSGMIVPLQTAVLGSDATVPATTGQGQAVQAARSAIGAVNSAIETRSSSLLAASSMPAGYQSVAEMVGSAGFLASAVASRSYVCRAASNLIPSA
jgi:hypothetical protein